MNRFGKRILPSTPTRDAQDGSGTPIRNGGHPTYDSGALLTKWTMPMLSAECTRHPLNGSTRNFTFCCKFLPGFPVRSVENCHRQAILIVCCRTLKITPLGTHQGGISNCGANVACISGDCKRGCKLHKSGGCAHSGTTKFTKNSQRARRKKHQGYVTFRRESYIVTSPKLTTCVSGVISA